MFSHQKTDFERRDTTPNTSASCLQLSGPDIVPISSAFPSLILSSSLRIIRIIILTGHSRYPFQFSNNFVILLSY